MEDLDRATASETPLPATPPAAWNLLADAIAPRLERGDPVAEAVLFELGHQLGSPIDDTARWPVTGRWFAKLHAHARRLIDAGHGAAAYRLAVEAIAWLRADYAPAPSSGSPPSTRPRSAASAPEVPWPGSRRSSAVGATSAGSSSSSSSAA